MHVQNKHKEGICLKVDRMDYKALLELILQL